MTVEPIELFITPRQEEYRAVHQITGPELLIVILNPEPLFAPIQEECLRVAVGRYVRHPLSKPAALTRVSTCGKCHSDGILLDSSTKIFRTVCMDSRPKITHTATSKYDIQSFSNTFGARLPTRLRGKSPDVEAGHVDPSQRFGLLERSANRSMMASRHINCDANTTRSTLDILHVAKLRHNLMTRI
ncbi:hypothetical protein J6590_005070 [Homalodisca vitripennis]|nr:hypothetical protein J6590_005070 [Homalodisca vitripennis]